MLIWSVVRGLLYPFLGTVLGSSFVFFMKKEPGKRLMVFLDSFAAGIMCAAAFFSLISPAVSQAETEGEISLLFCTVGFFVGIAVFVLTEKLLLILLGKSGNSANLLLWAVSIHNIPEGLAVGVIYSGLLYGTTDVNLSAAVSLSLGIAMQNIPEGAIVSLPLKTRGMKQSKAFFSGLISAAAELISGVFALFLFSFSNRILPFSMCFAAGAMFYVILAELSDHFCDKKTSPGALSVFAMGFCLMMMLDTFLG